MKQARTIVVHIIITRMRAKIIKEGDKGRKNIKTNSTMINIIKAAKAKSIKRTTNPIKVIIKGLNTIKNNPTTNLSITMNSNQEKQTTNTRRTPTIKMAIKLVMTTPNINNPIIINITRIRVKAPVDKKTHTIRNKHLTLFKIKMQINSTLTDKLITGIAEINNNTNKKVLKSMINTIVKSSKGIIKMMLIRNKCIQSISNTTRRKILRNSNSPTNIINRIVKNNKMTTIKASRINPINRISRMRTRMIINTIRATNSQIVTRTKVTMRNHIRRNSSIQDNLLITRINRTMRASNRFQSKSRTTILRNLQKQKINFTR